MTTSEQVVERTTVWAGRMIPRLYDLILEQQSRIEAMASAPEPDVDALTTEFERLAELQQRTVQLLQGLRTVDVVRKAEAAGMREVLDRLTETERMIAEVEAKG